MKTFEVVIKTRITMKVEAKDKCKWNIKAIQKDVRTY